MKKQLFYLLFLFVSALSFAQSSLDSLRLVLPVGHTDYIESIVYSPNGKFILSTSADKTAILWDAKTGKLLKIFDQNIAECHSGNFSSDNQNLLFISGNTVKVWNIISGQQIGVINFEVSSEYSSVSAYFSANGEEVIFVDWFAWYNISIYSLKKGLIQRNFKDVHDFCFDPTYNFLAITDDSIVKVLNVATDQVIWSVLLKKTVHAIDFSPSGNEVITTDYDNMLCLWNAKHGQLLKSIKLKEDYYGEQYCFNPNGKNFAVIDKNEISLRENQTGKKIVRSEHFKEEIYFKGFSEDGKYLIVYSKDSSLIVLNGNSGKILYKLQGIGSGYGTVPNYPLVKANSVESTLFVIDKYGFAKCYNLNSGHYLKVMEGRFGSLELNPIEKQFLTLSPSSDFYFDYSFRIWDLRNAKLLNRVHDKSETIRSMQLTSDNTKLLIAEENKAIMLDVAFAKRIQTFTHHSFNDVPLHQVQNVSFNHDESLIISYLGQFWSSNWDSCVHIWSISNENLLFTIKGHSDFISEAKFSPDGLYILTASSDSTIRIWNSKNGDQISRFGVHSEWVRSAEYNKDGSLILSRSDNEVLLVDAKNGNIVKHILERELPMDGSIQIHGPNIYGASYSSDFSLIMIQEEKTDYSDGIYTNLYSISVYDSLANYLFSIYSQNGGFLKFNMSSDGNKLIIVERGLNKVFVYNAHTGQFLYELIGNAEFEFAKFNDNGEKIVTGGMDNQMMIWDANDGKKLMALQGHNKVVLNAIFSTYDNFIISTGADNQLIVWDLIEGKPIYKLINLENNNWLVKLPNSPYYMCSKDASKMLHYVTPSLKVIGFEQLDPVYNRPDIVLDSIGKYFGNSDGGMIDEYRKSWEKRIDRLGLDKEKLGKGEIAVPSAEIVGADAIAYENKAGKLNITVSANDPKYPLRRFNVFVNEVPLYGSAGISIAHLKKQVWDTTVSVPLSLGENKIQVSVMNELGLENFKYPTYVNYTPTKEIVAKTHYIGIGVNEFKESSHNLKYCVKDVRDLAREFASENKNVDTLLFTDQQVTKENILALKDYLNKTGVNDKVIISCSSHGLLDDSLNFYLAMHDVDFNNPKARGLKYEALESLLDGIPARQKLLLLDACNSGENDKTEILKQELQQKEKIMDSSQVLAARGVIIKLEEENKSNFKKMNELFVNVRNNTGSVIISAAGGQESALEAISIDGKTIENGAFTYSILECLKQNEGKELKVNALKQYAEKRVEEITNGKQQPTSRQETMEVDWGVR